MRMETGDKLRESLHIGAWKAAAYEPTGEQWAAHLDESKLKLIAGGVGAGKSYWTAMELLKYIGTLNGLIWIIGPSYKLARPEWTYMLNICRKLGVVDESSVIDVLDGKSCVFKLLPEYGGCEVSTRSSTSPETVAAHRPDAIALVEAAQQPIQMYFKALERGTENDAAIIFSGTFEGSYTWYPQMWEKWQGPNDDDGRSFSIPTWSNHHKYPGGRNDPKIKKIEGMMPPDLFDERYGGVPCKPSGLVFKEFDHRVHVQSFKDLWVPELPVYLACDPATHAYVVLFMQIVGESVHVLDEVYMKNVIGQQVIPEVISKPLWPNVTKGVMDIAGARRQGANRSQVEVWAEELRTKGQQVVTWEHRDIRDVRLWYNCIHLRLWHSDEREPLLKFASHLDGTISPDGTANGVIGELLTHRWPELKDGTSNPTRPIKKNEDALSAVGYFLYANFGPVEKTKHRTRPHSRAKPYYHDRTVRTRSPRPSFAVRAGNGGLRRSG